MMMDQTTEFKVIRKVQEYQEIEKIYEAKLNIKN